MSHYEFMEWLDYFTRVGRFTPRRMFDAPAALIASRVDRLLGENNKPADFLRYGNVERPAADMDSPQEITLDQVARAFGGLHVRR